MSSIYYEVDQVTASLGIEVENLLKVMTEPRKGSKDKPVPRFSLEELLSDDFEIPQDLLDSRHRTYRSAEELRRMAGDGEGGESAEVEVDIDEFDIDDIETESEA